MHIMNKTPLGTISAHRWTNGICTGIYGKGNFISVEYNKETNKIEVLINDDIVKEQDIVVKHLSHEEFIK